MTQCWNVILLLFVQIRPECKGATTGGREGGRLEGPETPNNLLTPNFGHSGGRFNSFVLNVSLGFLWKVDFSRFSILLYTRLNDLKFENPKLVLGRGSPSPLPGTPHPFLGLSPRKGGVQRIEGKFSLDSGFALKSQALRALDSSFIRFGSPQRLKRGCALAQMDFVLAFFKKGLTIALGVAVQCRIYIISHVHKAYDLHPFGFLQPSLWILDSPTEFFVKLLMVMFSGSKYPIYGDT